MTVDPKAAEVEGLVKEARQLLQSHADPGWHPFILYNDNLIDRLAAALEAQSSTPRNREGWVLVPKEPTEAMVDAADDANDTYRMTSNFREHAHLGPAGTWKAMLAAAPPAVEDEGSG
jgi:hypothetical protein